jgi:hypothetical protein
MNDLLTPCENQEAARQGWGIFNLYDATRSAWIVWPMPVRLKDGERVSDTVSKVVALAKMNNELAIKALRLMTQHNMKAKKK